MTKSRILCVDDDGGMLEVCQDSLSLIDNVEVIAERDPRIAFKRLENEDYDLLVTDLNMPGMSGSELIRKVRELDTEMAIVILTGFPTVETAIESMKLGVSDYVTKPFDPDDLIATAERLLEIRLLRQENRLLRRRIEGSSFQGDMLGASQPMLEVFDTIERIADTDVDVLVEGETGTGKELVARALHHHSSRGEHPFVPVNCGAIPEHLLESEFFGHEKGAFTGASGRSIGLMEYAEGGTLFLDEIIELPASMQAKLLRALQERKIRRLGGNDEININIRIIAATARDLHQAVRDNVFRDDLFYRINVVTIHLPPVRDREDDTDLMVNFFFERYAQEMGKQIRGISNDALIALKDYAWPGNVRELQNVVRRAIAVTRNDTILLEDLPPYIAELRGGAGHELRTNGFYKARDDYLARFEHDYLISLMRKYEGRVSKALDEADMPRGSFYRLLKKHSIVPDAYRTKP